MFIKLTRASGHTYAQLVESFRDEQGRPRQRTLATLGRIDETGGQVDAVLGTLLRARGRAEQPSGAPQVRFESALALGDVWALLRLLRAAVCKAPRLAGQKLAMACRLSQAHRYSTGLRSGAYGGSDGAWLPASAR